MGRPWRLELARSAQIHKRTDYDPRKAGSYWREVTRRHEGVRLGLRGPVILAIAIWKVARSAHLAVKGLDVVDGFGVLTLARLFSVNGHA